LKKKGDDGNVSFVIGTSLEKFLVFCSGQNPGSLVLRKRQDHLGWNVVTEIAISE
jgi:hypothetical protein